ncbi:MAG: protein-L-isoaspartate(D-aspartate) O-methyltransferase [Candidatus Omnitrophota bacterium]|nr:MAG: protein-L-isoaspartate(D-aspartate) O-methyltransferase [Candidatus Omnitrophota bacterium]
MKENKFNERRKDMVARQIVQRGITEPKIIEAFSSVQRHLFIPEYRRIFAYNDYPISIGEGQTISQPYMVALMTQLLEVRAGQKVLEIGTGSGYQAAILAHMGAQVYSIERIDSLAQNAKTTLDSLGYNVQVHVGDGTLGWPEHAPYDRMIVTAAAPKISPCWAQQLVIGGKIVIPLGTLFYQTLTVAEKVSEEELKVKSHSGCVFVPLIGKYGYRE